MTDQIRRAYAGLRARRVGHGQALATLSMQTGWTKAEVERHLKQKPIAARDMRGSKRKEQLTWQRRQ